MMRTVTQSDSYSIFRFWQTEKRNEKEPVEAAMPPKWLSWWIFAGRVAAKNDTPELVKELARIHKNLAAARKRGDRDALLKANFAFHFALYSAAHMPYLLFLIENLWVQTASYLTFMYQPPFPGLAGEHPHSAIIAALKRHDVDKVVGEIRRDIEAHGEILMKTLRDRGIIV